MQLTREKQLRREEIIAFLQSLRQSILKEFEAFEINGVFKKKPWEHLGGGGGEIALLRGELFEKAAVNWSGVTGDSFPTQDAKGPFFATGVSVITHMMNPHLPTVHFNLRYIETQEKFWFGGGYDLSPMGRIFTEDTQHFHSVAKNTLDPFGPTLYSDFSENAKNYFYLPHRKKERGVGGIFFDHYNTSDFSVDWRMWTAIGNSFLKAIMPIYNRRRNSPYTPQEKDQQLQLRAHYAEFNLIYDRGTKFGFQSGGNPDAILCSMPPVVKW